MNICVLKFKIWFFILKKKSFVGGEGEMIRLSLGCIVTLFLLGSCLGVPGNEDSGNGIYTFRDNGDSVKVPKSSYETLHIFCHPGRNDSLDMFWGSVHLTLKIHSEDYRVYVAPNVSAVMEMYQDNQFSWFNSGRPWKPKDLHLSPFESTCVGVLTKVDYQTTLLVWTINLWQFGMTVVGIFLFIFAPMLCSNVIFHYATGVAIGIFFSLFVLTYFLHRKFKFWLSFLVMFYSLSFYTLTSGWYNIQTYLIEHHLYVLSYVAIVGGISFAVAYRMGPIENRRTLNLIQWTIQLCALGLIFKSSYHQTASLGLALVILIWVNIPISFKSKVQTEYHRRFFKPKVKLLTESEYLDQSQVQTENALNELRKFCQSPDCDAWKLASKLRQPSRFAEFIEGSSHITQEEVTRYSEVDLDDEAMDDNQRAPLTDDDSIDEIDMDLANADLDLSFS